MRQKVYVLGAHPLNGYSMRRYTELLAQTYSGLGYEVEVLRPTSRFSDSCRSLPLRKLVVYIEKLALFPITISKIEPGTHVHVADHSDGIWLLHPALRNRGAVITCHDLFAIRAAAGDIEEHRPKWPGRIYQYLIRRGICRAGRIISVSQCTNTDVSNWIRGPIPRVVHNPLADSFRVPNNHWNGGYALVVGTQGWRKRRDLAIRAWLQLRRVSCLELPLVIVGPPLTPAEQLLVDKEEVRAAEVTIKTDVSELELVHTYQGAQFLILASKYEGFAWPILEANALGIPVLCANEPILRETGAGNIFFDDPNNVDWKSIYTELLELHGSHALQKRALSFSTTHFAHSLRAALDS